MHFARLSEKEIEAYIATEEPMDKAGAYAIQDDILRPVESYDGCYCNVVGLPLWTTLDLMRKAELDVRHVTLRDLLPQCAACPLHAT